jgi:hypothetical protein
MSTDVGEAQKMDGNSIRRTHRNYPPYSIEVPLFCSFLSTVADQLFICNTTAQDTPKEPGLTVCGGQRWLIFLIPTLFKLVVY